MKPAEITQQAKFFADNATSYCGGQNAERILKLAYEKVKAKNEYLRRKYDEQESMPDCGHSFVSWPYDDEEACKFCGLRRKKE